MPPIIGQTPVIQRHLPVRFAEYTAQRTTTFFSASVYCRGGNRTYPLTVTHCTNPLPPTSIQPGNLG